MAPSEIVFALLVFVLSAPKAYRMAPAAVNQIAAMNILVGNADGARTALQGYFQNQFKDQIAASGEQPFEAVRTRPYHYRCFNLEAMIVSRRDEPMPACN